MTIICAEFNHQSTALSNRSSLLIAVMSGLVSTSMNAGLRSASRPKRFVLVPQNFSTIGSPLRVPACMFWVTESRSLRKRCTRSLDKRFATMTAPSRSITFRISPIGVVDSTVTNALIFLNYRLGVTTVIGQTNKKPSAAAEGFLTRSKSELAEKDL